MVPLTREDASPDLQEGNGKYRHRGGVFLRVHLPLGTISDDSTCRFIGETEDVSTDDHIVDFSGPLLVVVEGGGDGGDKGATPLGLRDSLQPNEDHGKDCFTNLEGRCVHSDTGSVERQTASSRARNSTEMTTCWLYR